MSRFTQDALENFFSCVRRKGDNDHPTPNDFKNRIPMLMAECIIVSCTVDSAKSATLIRASCFNVNSENRS